MNNFKLTIAITLLYVLSSCRQEELIQQQASDYFFVRNNKVDLPVLVEGNTASQTFILYIHGGPEVGAIAESRDRVFWNELEKKYAVVYYDQRGLGMSNGNFDENTLTIEQFVDDLDKIISVVKGRYGNDISIFLMGGSWGGFVGTAYITTRNNQEKVKGWIEIGGAHDMKLIQEKLPAHVAQIANQQIAKNKSPDEWNRHLTFATQYDLTDQRFEHWLKLIQQYSSLTALLEKDNEFDIRKTHVNIHPGINILSLWANDNINQVGIKLLRKYYHTSLSSNLKGVNLPSCFFWGEYDCASPPALAFDAYDHIGTPPQDKNLKIFKNADHTILLTKPEELLAEIYNFVERYK